MLYLSSGGVDVDRAAPGPTHRGEAFLHLGWMGHDGERYHKVAVVIDRGDAEALHAELGRMLGR